MKEKFGKFLASEKKKLAGMDRRQKIAYLAEYYWLWALGIFGGLFMAVYILWHAFFTVKDYRFYVLFVNAPIEASQEIGNRSALRQGFIDRMGYDLKEGMVEFGTASYFNAAVDGGSNNSYFQSFVAVVEAGHLDAAVMEEDNLKAIGAAGRFLDLSRGEAADLFAPYADRFVYAVPYDTEYSEDPVPVGIDISDSDLGRMGVYEDGCVLGIGAYSSHPEDVKAFLEYIGAEGRQP